MIIHLYAIAYNEARLMPFFMRHYWFCDRITILNHGSTDRTCEIAESMGAIVETCPANPSHIDEYAFRDIVNSRWKKDRSEADWIIWVDLDEFLYTIGGPRYSLTWMQYNGITLPRVQGYTMISERFPTDGAMIERCFLGVPDALYSKQAIFSTKIAEINYGIGRHNCHPVGNIKRDFPGKIKLLHYPYFGEKYFLERRQRLHSRRGRVGQYEPPAEGRYSLEWYKTVKTEDVR